MVSRNIQTERDDLDRMDKEFIGSRDDRPEDRTVSSRARVRQEVTSQVEAFLAGGGRIAEIEPNVMADPPRKPSSNYGSRPI